MFIVTMSRSSRGGGRKLLRLSDSNPAAFLVVERGSPEARGYAELIWEMPGRRDLVIDCYGGRHTQAQTFQAQAQTFQAQAQTF